MTAPDEAYERDLARALHHTRTWLLRISVSTWSADPSDVRRSIDAVTRAAAEPAGQ